MKNKERGKNKKSKIGIIAKSIIIIFAVLLFLVFCCRNKGLTITLNVDNKEYHEITNIKKGEIVEEPKNPEKEGHVFAGWFLDGEKFDFEVPITDSIELVAKWDINKYNVTIKTGTGSIINDVVEHNGTINAPKTPTKEGYVFAGWYSNEEKFDFDTKITSDIVIEAKWTKKNYTTYIVEHYLMDKEGNYPSKPTEKEILTGKIDSIVTPTVKDFKGYTSPSVESIKVVINGDATVRYYYSINTYKLTINGDIGVKSVTGDGSYFYGDQVEINYIIKDGYTLTGFSENVKNNIYTMTDEDVSIIISTKANSDTKYVVEHYKMNLEGKYDKKASEKEVLNGTTDTKIVPNVKTYIGFTSPKKEETIIRGDGTTVVKYYYERNKYELNLIRYNKEENK